MACRWKALAKRCPSGPPASSYAPLPGNPMDVHLHTSVNLRRYLVQLDGLSRRNKLLALLLWHTGPEVRSTQRRMQPPRNLTRPLSQPCPIGPKTSCSMSSPRVSISSPRSTGRRSPTSARYVRRPRSESTVHLAQQYVNCGYDATALIARLAEIVCHDNFTEMHAFKHHQAIVEEFYATREPWRWLHLVAGAQAAAISFGKNMEIYEEALELLHA